MCNYFTQMKTISAGLLYTQDKVLSVLEALILQTNADTCKCLHRILCSGPLDQFPSLLKLSCPPLNNPHAHRIRRKTHDSEVRQWGVGTLENLRLLCFKEQQLFSLSWLVTNEISDLIFLRKLEVWSIMAFHWLSCGSVSLAELLPGEEKFFFFLQLGPPERAKYVSSCWDLY